MDEVILDKPRHRESDKKGAEGIKEEGDKEMGRKREGESCLINTVTALWQ